MDDPIRIWCGPDKPRRWSAGDYKKSVTLNSFPGGNVFLKAENISRRLAADIPDIALDLLEIGSYVYCGDQTTGRGGQTWPENGAGWNRRFSYHIPVRCPNVWNSRGIKEALVETLSFLTDDNFTFHFRGLDRKLPGTPYFDFDEDEPWFEADEVLLFSGGLDSLAGAVTELSANKKLALVSHRPFATISGRQTRLVEELRSRHSGTQSILHVPVWVNKAGGLTKDANQRARSFLYVCLAAAIAQMSQTNRICFYENGIVSSNLPISGQVIGARASRSTHPKALDGFQRLLTKVLDKPMTVCNPFFLKTKSDVVGVLKEHSATELIGLTNSCSHTRTTDKVHTHCGVCSQCIERRLATIYHGLETEDPGDKYRTDLFLDPIEDEMERTMVVSYLDHCRELESLDEHSFFQKFPEAARIPLHLEGKSSESAAALLDLHKRHVTQVAEVVQNQIAAHGELIWSGDVPALSGLDIILGQSGSSAVACDDTGDAFKHSDDYRSIAYEGVEYSPSSKQAEVIQKLHEEHLHGTPEVSWTRIKTEIAGEDSSYKSLSKLFRGKEGKRIYKRLISKGKRQGTYRLNIESPIEPQSFDRSGKKKP